MSNDVVIKVENLSKQYRIGSKEGYRTFRETLVDATKTPFQGISKLLNRQSQDTIWVLKDENCSIWCTTLDFFIG